MSEFESRPEHSKGHGNWLWHFDGHKMDWRLDVRDDHGPDRLRSDLDDAKLHHYLRMGVIRADVEEEKERAVVPDRKGVVVAWLVGLAAFWIVFRLVRI